MTEDKKFNPFDSPIFRVLNSLRRKEEISQDMLDMADKEWEEGFRYTHCTYCGHKTERLKSGEIFEHIFSCEKRPEKTIIAQALEIEAGLHQNIIHLTADHHFTPETCAICEDIGILIANYQSGDENPQEST